MYTILVTDDDPMLIDVLAEVLEEQDYTVLTARDAYEAIRLIADRHVDLMITDLRLPGLDGIGLAAQAKLIRPHLRIIYISGYDTKAEGGTLPTYGYLLQKPVRPDALLATVEQELVCR